MSRVLFSDFYHGAASAQTLAREEGWEYFIFVWTEFYSFTVSGFDPTAFRFGIKKKMYILKSIEPTSIRPAFHAATTKL